MKEIIHLPYNAAYTTDGLPYVEGPSDGHGTYWTSIIPPNLKCEDMDEAERAARLANLAYKAGYHKAQADIRKAIGATP